MKKIVYEYIILKKIVINQNKKLNNIRIQLQDKTKELKELQDNTKIQLQDYLVYHYTNEVSSYIGEDKLQANIDELSRSGADKDLSWKAFNSYMPGVCATYCEMKGRVNKLGDETPAIKAYIKSIEIDALRKSARATLLVQQLTNGFAFYDWAFVSQSEL